jgi:curved DNA-binding protein CbpA
MERILYIASFMGRISERAPGRTCCDYEERKEINVAYQILGNEEKRRRYDLQYRNPFENYMFYEEGVDDDFVSVLRKFSQMGFNAKRTGGCRRKGLGRGMCGRWKK